MNHTPINYLLRSYQYFGPNLRAKNPREPLSVAPPIPQRWSIITLSYHNINTRKVPTLFVADGLWCIVGILTRGVKENDRRSTENVRRPVRKWDADFVEIKSRSYWFLIWQSWRFACWFGLPGWRFFFLPLVAGVWTTVSCVGGLLWVCQRRGEKALYKWTSADLDLPDRECGIFVTWNDVPNAN